ncbi:LacI family DNA-binding transcriptional regulator [candidate division KSB1 bacterium]|nr:LacI family DNA-binding transcriptional regulator [candidate division KSB1 bacterium]
MQTTIYDVAKKAGVGIGTVSRVINNSPQISPKTRDKVRKVIKELKYQPSIMARGLARKSTNTIACIVPSFTGYFYFELLNGVQKVISKKGYDLILYSVDLFDKKEEIFKRTIRERRVDGVLIISMTVSDTSAEKFIQSKLPLTLIDSFHKNLDSITIENREGALIATRHLIKLGHKKLGMINGSLSSVPARIRLDGFKEALAESDITADERFIVNTDISNNSEFLNNDGFNKAAGYRAMQTILNENNNRPTAVFIASDIQAVGAIRAIREKGLRIPDDIAIVGFDDIELSEYLGLTTIHQPMFEMGTLAANRLTSKIAGTNSKDLKKVFSTKLVIRETCGALNNNGNGIE